MKISVLVFACLVFLFPMSGAASGATFVVSKTADTNDGVCDADCSLREAMASVLPRPAVNRIEFSSLFNGPQTIELSSLISLDVEADVTIAGRGNHNVTLTTAAGNTVGSLGFGFGTVKLVNLRFANGTGGAILANASDSKNQIPLFFEVDRCAFENNSAALSGGAIKALVVYGSVTIKDSTFRNNSAGDAGGAVKILNSGASITDSSFIGNTAPFGSAIYFDETFNQPTLLENSTFVNNHSPGNVFGINSSTIHNRGRVNLVNVTIAGNTAASATPDSAALYDDAAFNSETNLRNSIVSQNAFGNINASVTLSAPNLIGGDPLFGVLAFNGGETETLGLLTGSPAIDAASPTGAPGTDQRGASRPQGAGFDLGAFESGVAITSAGTPTGSNINASLGAVSVTFSGVTQAGTTTQIPISPSGAPPGGYSFGAGFPAFQISTTAQYTPPITLCLSVPPATPLNTFNALEILHFENGSWVALTPTTRDTVAYTICAPTNSLSPFAVAQNLVPTAANVEISGRVFSGSGAVAHARVFLTDQNGSVKTATTNSFGVYRFLGVPVGTYTMNVSARENTYEVRVVSVNESMENLDFFPASRRRKQD